MEEVDHLLREDGRAWRASLDRATRGRRVKFTPSRNEPIAPGVRRRRFVQVIALVSCVGALGALIWWLDVNAGSGSSGDQGSCVAPRLTASTATIPAGRPLTLAGHYFFSTCNDAQAGGQVASLHSPTAKVELRLTDVEDRTYPLGVAHPDRAGASTITVLAAPGLVHGLIF
jgi:hypothetical protein